MEIRLVVVPPLRDLRIDTTLDYKNMHTPRKPVVLVVDDNYGVANTLALVLQASGYVTAVAYSGKEAVEMMSGIAADAAIVDVNLPDVDGVRTAVEICNRLPNCKILLMSGHPDAISLLDRMKGEGVNFQVLPKPMQPPELLDAIAALLSSSARA